MGLARIVFTERGGWISFFLRFTVNVVYIFVWLLRDTLMIHTDAGGRLLLPFLSSLFFFCSFYLSAFEKEGWKEKSHVGYVIGHMDSEVLYEVMNRSWSGGEGAWADEAVLYM
jgi:hypothetical protein